MQKPSMSKTILVTGSAGLIGSAVVGALRGPLHHPRSFDLRSADPNERSDVRDFSSLCQAMEGCDGVIHLAAVSRVVWGEQDPDVCLATNVQGTRNVVRAAQQAKNRPWVLLASSREVYGQAAVLPATEDTPLRPLNVYARSKIEAERCVLGAREGGTRTAILRLSNVYGGVVDHEDRVIPAFVGAGLRNGTLRLDGAGSTFDFTHLEDTVRGIITTVQLLEKGESTLPPIHLLTGKPTTLQQLADTVLELAESNARIEHAPARSYDVSRFFGDPRRARQWLGWEARVALRDGLLRLIRERRRQLRRA